MSGSLYILMGVLAIAVGIYLILHPYSLGYYYLGVGMLLLSLYMIGKGSVMLYYYYSRYGYYKMLDEASVSIIRQEQEYLTFRIKKKKQNRRRYMYIVLVAFLASGYAFYSLEKGLILATCIPIALISIWELVIGLMTEFRLYQMLKITRSMKE